MTDTFTALYVQPRKDTLWSYGMVVSKRLRTEDLISQKALTPPSKRLDCLSRLRARRIGLPARETIGLSAIDYVSLPSSPPSGECAYADYEILAMLPRT